jgi:single-strand DNA-binding protein
MTSFNKIILIGRLTRDPEMRYTPNGTPVCHFTLAVDRNKASSKDGTAKENETDFIDIVAWQKLAEICQQYLGKGRLVAVDGRLQIRNYETQDGQRRKAVEVVANDMRILDKPSSKPEELVAKVPTGNKSTSAETSSTLEEPEVFDTNDDMPF